MIEFIVGFVLVALIWVGYEWWKCECVDRVWVEEDNEWWSNPEVRGMSPWEG